jgi:hypothetical protein
MCSTSRPLTPPVLKLLLLTANNHKSDRTIHAGLLQINPFLCFQISFHCQPVSFRPSMSRIRGLLNILASNADVNRDDDQNLAAGARFENAATMRSCHSNHPCLLPGPGTICFLSLAKLYIYLDAPTLQAPTATDQSALSFVFSSLVILSFTSHRLGCLTFFNPHC